MYGWQYQVDLDGDTDQSACIEGSVREECLEPVNSVIVIGNCDCDEPSTVLERHPDNQDNRINGADDLKDVEPVLLRRFPCLSGELTLCLRSDPDAPDSPASIRVFGPFGQEVLGPETGECYTLNSEERQNYK